MQDALSQGQVVGSIGNTMIGDWVSHRIPSPSPAILGIPATFPLEDHFLFFVFIFMTLMALAVLEE